MGLIDRVFGLLFGTGASALRQTAEVFVENAEKSAARRAGLRRSAVTQFAGEFDVAQRGFFDRLMDALNRIPRPALALGTLALFVSAMVDPIWFAARMQGIALVPEPMWWLLGAIVSFYFGARHQWKSQQFQRQIAQNMTLTPQVLQNLEALQDMQERAEESDQKSGSEGALGPQQQKTKRVPSDLYPNNAALRDWARARAGQS